MIGPGCQDQYLVIVSVPGGSSIAVVCGSVVHITNAYSPFAVMPGDQGADWKLANVDPTGHNSALKIGALDGLGTTCSAFPEGAVTSNNPEPTTAEATAWRQKVGRLRFRQVTLVVAACITDCRLITKMLKRFNDSEQGQTNQTGSALLTRRYPCLRFWDREAGVASTRPGALQARVQRRFGNVRVATDGGGVAVPRRFADEVIVNEKDRHVIAAAILP